MSRRGVAMAWKMVTSLALDRAHLSSASTMAMTQGLCAVQGAASALDTISIQMSTNPPQRPSCCRPAASHSPGPRAEPDFQNGSLKTGLLNRLFGSRYSSAGVCWRPQAHARGFSASAAVCHGGSSGGDGNGNRPGTSTGGSGSGTVAGETRISLGEALNQLVDAAIEKVEAGQMEEAVSLLKDGLSTFEPVFPNSPELGELHNQAALLLLFQGRVEEAAYHAQASLDTTKRHFGTRSLLTAHRLLRLGVCRFAQGKMADAAGLLREALDLLDVGGVSASGAGPAAAGDAASGAADPGSRCETGFYLDCVALAHVTDRGGVDALSGSLRANVRGMKEAYGAESMVLSLALSQHSRLVNGGLEQADFLVGEALLKQQIMLLSEVSGPQSEDAAVARYKLATYYYSNDMLQDAGSAVQQAAVALRAHYPEEHDLMVLCKHRLGMICAAQGDHRSASQLLQASRQHFSGEGGQAMLAKEADIGLAMAKFRAVDAAREPSAQCTQLRHEALELLRTEIEALATAIGHGHMLVQGATRYYGQLSKIAR
ncbi:hypothetical protein Vretimale_13336 [Volvox reticuliferus]|uniref:MalT-like TPR region domain-containing protein n=1 Tax=Volvox reticuliferus TaxID=1737510 RepID=A0A8J4CPB8_9CHLO|nr:hypothetical protein Vretifemale_14056 [Volvox reticuliferus]GIM09489.1 hypothetical protein Vretimale_13336 [Volvox reticuliferus]